MPMSNSKPVGPSVELEASEDQAVKVSLASKGSTISSDRVKGVQEVLVIHSAIFSKNSRKCSVEAAREAHRDVRSSKQKDKTLL
jgi:hypothetical protein